jgi:uncharacterized protein (DUF2235 family)
MHVSIQSFFSHIQKRIITQPGKSNKKKCALLLIGESRSIAQTMREPSQNRRNTMGCFDGTYSATKSTPKTTILKLFVMIEIA